MIGGEEVIRARIAHLSPAEIRLARTWLGVERHEIAGPPEGVIVGEAPGKHTSPRLPMFPWPASSAGGRLLKMAGITAGEYIGRLRRRNLWETYEQAEEAGAPEDRARGELALDSIFAFDANERIVVLGDRVARAFGLDGIWKSRTVTRGDTTVEIKSIAHPSGRSLVYNDAKARACAQAAVLWAAGFV